MAVSLLRFGRHVERRRADPQGSRHQHRGRNVLIVEDVATRFDPRMARAQLAGTRTQSLRLFTLLRKPEAVRNQVDVAYIGFDIDNEFVVGYGMDRDEKFRNMRLIGVLNGRNSARGRQFRHRMNKQVVIQRPFRTCPPHTLCLMDAKRIFRGPSLDCGGVLLVLGTQLFADFGGPKSVDTWRQAVSYIQGNQAKSATLVDKEQRIELTLQDGSKVTSSYIDGQASSCRNSCRPRRTPVSCPMVTTSRFRARICSFHCSSSAPRRDHHSVLFFFMGQMQGGGSKIMNFGKAKTKAINGHAETTFADVRAPTRHARTRRD